MHNHLCIRLYKHVHTQAWCNDKRYDTIIHPIVKCVLLPETLRDAQGVDYFRDPPAGP